MVGASGAPAQLLVVVRDRGASTTEYGTSSSWTPVNNFSHKTTPPVCAETGGVGRSQVYATQLDTSFLGPTTIEICFPLRFAPARRLLQRCMRTSQSKMRKSCQQNARSMRGSPTATIQRLPAYSAYEFQFSSSDHKFSGDHGRLVSVTTQFLEHKYMAGVVYRPRFEATQKTRPPGAGCVRTRRVR